MVRVQEYPPFSLLVGLFAVPLYLFDLCILLFLVLSFLSIFLRLLFPSRYVRYVLLMGRAELYWMGGLMDNEEEACVCVCTVVGMNGKDEIQ